mmetsp:Transcript_113286/g.360077  ORF Transcript_113286/g.360077 Transcript_113286/m.360077 type:complete len:133 (+) Transcript_113286:79-477(+)
MLALLPGGSAYAAYETGSSSTPCPRQVKEAWGFQDQEQMDDAKIDEYVVHTGATTKAGVRDSFATKSDIHSTAADEPSLDDPGQNTTYACIHRMPFASVGPCTSMGRASAMCVSPLGKLGTDMRSSLSTHMP